MDGLRLHGTAGRDEEIAIIGVAGRYPMAPDLDAFWRNLAAGRDCIVEVPQERWDHAALFDPRKGVKGRTYGRWGGFLDGADRFDPAFFGISRKEAERMDPQERLFLTTSWHALEDAGYAPDSLGGQKVGVFVGVMWNHYQLVRDESEGAAPTALHAAIANRVSFTLDLHGPSLAIDTMCSSSLTAIHLAVESIRRGECTMAIAGGTNAFAHPEKYLQLARGHFLSEDGRCRAFGKGGTGYVPGEGVGAVVLKPLTRAAADRDHVWGVLKGSSLNHSGRTSGFTVPSPASQAALLREAFAQAGVDPKTLGYIEAHGTGTSLGDPIEIEALRQVFAASGAPAGGCAIGSVKSNIGHLESAAGIAGLTKVLLQLEHRQLAPSLHADEPNPYIEFATAPVRLQRALEPWPAPPSGGPRRAGLSAFGAGGANVHVVLEEAVPVRDDAPAWDGPCVFVLSARDETVLREYASAFVRFLDGALDLSGGSSLDDVTYTMQVGRKPMATRLAVVACAFAELRATLDRYVRDEAPSDGGFWGPTPRPATISTAAALRALWSDGQLTGLAARWQAGVDVDWAALYPRATHHALPRRVSLPTYPFREEPCWIGRWSASERERGATRADTTPLPKAPPPAHAGSEVELRFLDPGIALLTMQDGEHQNMFTAGLIAGLEGAFAEIARRQDVKVVVLTGSAEVFSMGATPGALDRLARKKARFSDVPFVYEGLLRCDRPVVAAMQGHASGGGFIFGLYADVIVMSRDAVYTANFLKYGFTPGMGATYILERRVGSALASEMFFTGRALCGYELERRGCQAVFRAGGEVLSAALDLARAIAENPATAIRALKHELARRVLARLPAVVEREVAMHAHVLGTEALKRIHDHFEKGAKFRARSVDEAATALPAAERPVDATRPEGPE